MKGRVAKASFVLFAVVLALFSAGGAVLADDGDVGPMAVINITVSPNKVPNDGASVMKFTWDASDLTEDDVAAYYTFHLSELGETAPYLGTYIQYSDGAGTDGFVGITTGLQDIECTVFGPAVHILNPEAVGSPPVNTHDWTVPEGLPAGQYSVWVNIYKYVDPPDPCPPATAQPTALEASASITVTITESVLIVRKFNDLDGDGVRDAGEPEIIGDFSVLVTDAGGATVYDGTMPKTLVDLAPGDYTATETVEPGWKATTPTTETVTLDPAETETIWFGNQELAELIVRKFNDLDGDGVMDAGEPELVGEFSVLVTDAGGATVYDGTMPKTLGDLDPGDYTATETVESGWSATTPTTQTATLDPGDSETIWFGNRQPSAELTVRKFNDYDRDGVKDPDEPEIVGQFDVEVTDAGGATLYDGTMPKTLGDLAPGTYTATETVETGWTPTTPTTQTVTLADGDSETIWFGNWKPTVPTLSQWGIIGMAVVFASLLVWTVVRRRRLTPDEV
jgi:hypothetical protein